MRSCPKTGKEIQPRRISRRVRASSELPAPHPKIPALPRFPEPPPSTDHPERVRPFADTLPRFPVSSASSEPGSGPAAFPAVLPITPGEIINGKYEVLRVLGAGAMGTVFECRHTRLGKHVAIKVLSTVSAANPMLVRRFHREARAAAALRHPNVCDVIDVGTTEDGIPYLVMELLIGETLETRLEHQRQLSLEDSCAIGIATLAGLKAAHAAGVVHRDVKPGNVFLAAAEEGAEVKLIDFGISKFASTETTELTRLGHLVGTPAYMAPEQARGLRIDHRVDIYATGVLLYECVTGCRPFEAETLDELLVKIRTGLFPSLRFLRPDVPERLETIILHAMQVDPDKRPSVDQMLQRLREIFRELALASGPDSDAPVSIVLDEAALGLTDDDDDLTEVRPPKSFD
jgi:serine/threonine protein kinase